MPSRLDEILQQLASGELTLDDACRTVSTLARSDPSGTRMWSMLIESRISQQQLPLASGRALLDALESFEPEKTMWLAPSANAASSLAKSQPAHDLLRTPAGKRPEPAVPRAGPGPYPLAPERPVHKARPDRQQRRVDAQQRPEPRQIQSTRRTE